MLKNNYWRDSAREVKFFIFDWKMSVIFIIFILNLTSLWAYIMFFFTIPFFQYLNYKGYNMANFFRAVNLKLIGKKAHGKPYWFRRKYL